MELLTKEIYNLRLNPEDNGFIYNFSRLELSNLNLKPEKKVLVGFLIFNSYILPVNNCKKSLFMAVTTYLTDKKYKYIYPFSINMDVVTEKLSQKPEKIFKTKYNLTKQELDKIQLFEIYNLDNIKIYAVNVPKISKKLKEMKLTKVIHMYSDPFIQKDVTQLYPQILSTNFSGLNKRFFFFYNNIKVSLKEKHILERIN